MASGELEKCQVQMTPDKQAVKLIQHVILGGTAL